MPCMARGERTSQSPEAQREHAFRKILQKVDKVRTARTPLFAVNPAWIPLLEVRVEDFGRQTGLGREESEVMAAAFSEATQIALRTKFNHPLTAGKNDQLAQLGEQRVESKVAVSAGELSRRTNASRQDIMSSLEAAKSAGYTMFQLLYSNPGLSSSELLESVTKVVGRVVHNRNANVDYTAEEKGPDTGVRVVRRNVRHIPHN